MDLLEDPLSNRCNAPTWYLFLDIADRISDLLKENGDDYTFTLVGHSLGAGVASLFAILMVNNAAKFGNIDRSRIRCFAIAPARCTSINLAVRYADVIRSIVLQVRKLRSDLESILTDIITTYQSSHKT